MIENKLTIEEVVGVEEVPGVFDEFGGSIRAQASRIFDEDLARANLFFLQFPNLPNCLLGKAPTRLAMDTNRDIAGDIMGLMGRPGIKMHANATLRNMPLYCKAVTMPGKSLLTNEIQNDGALRKLAYDSAYPSDLNIEFYSNPTYDIYKLIEYWISTINPETGIIEYYDNYIVDNVELFVLDRQTKISSKFVFTEVFPASIEPIQYQSGTGSFSTFVVNFNYYAYTTNDHF